MRPPCGGPGGMLRAAGLTRTLPFPPPGATSRRASALATNRPRAIRRTCRRNSFAGRLDRHRLPGLRGAVTAG